MRLNNISDDFFCGTSYYSNNCAVDRLGDRWWHATGYGSERANAGTESGSSAINAAIASLLSQHRPTWQPTAWAVAMWVRSSGKAINWSISGGDNQQCRSQQRFHAPLTSEHGRCSKSAIPCPAGQTISFSCPDQRRQLEQHQLQRHHRQQPLASANVTANSISGSYVVTATAS